MANKKKLLAILTENFSENPEVLARVQAAIEVDYKNRLALVESKMQGEHRESMLSLRNSFQETLQRSIDRMAQDFVDRLAIESNKIHETGEVSGSVRDRLDLLEGKLKKKEERLEQTLDKYARRIEKVSEIGMGAPNRSFYLNGKIISGVYSDVNLIPGSNVNISEFDNATTHMADVTITASGGSGFTTLAATQTPNGLTAAFTFAGASAQPSYIISDGVWMRATAADGTVNWTWNNGTKTATMTIPPTDDILGVV